MKRFFSLLVVMLHMFIIHAQDSIYFRANEWKEQIEQYYRNDQKEFPEPGAVLFVGSSTMRMWNNIESYFPTHKVINRGFGGAWISDLLYHIQRLVIDYRPGQIVLYAGANDMSNGISPQRVFEDIKCFVRIIEINLPGVPVIILSFRTSPSTTHRIKEQKWVNQQLEEYYKNSSNVTFLDIASMMYGTNGKLREELYLKDRLHVTPEAYRMMADKLEPLLIKNGD